MPEALTGCDGCGRATKTIHGRCPNCGRVKAAAAVLAPARRPGDSGFWDGPAWVVASLLPGLAVMGLGWLLDSDLVIAVGLVLLTVGLGAYGFGALPW